MPPSEKEKQICFCVDCLNPQVLLKSINGYISSVKQTPHKSLTTYLRQRKTGKKFDEISAVKICKYYHCKGVEESYIRKEGKHIEYTRTTRTYHSEPVNKIVAKLSEVGDIYLNQRTYVDNGNTVFSLLKGTYTGKLVEFVFSQNISIRPKDPKFNALTFLEGNLHCIERFSTLQSYVIIII